MKKFSRKKRNILIGILSFITMTGFAFGVMNATAETQNKEVLLSEVLVQSEYSIGQKLSIPQATLTLNGEEKHAQSVVVYPDGSKYGSLEIVLSQAGKYVIEYTAYFGNTKYTESVDFIVSQPLYEIKNSVLGSANYYDDYALTEYDNSISELKGVLATMPSGTEFVYHDIIDFSNKTQNDSFLDFAILPSLIGERDFAELFIKLTDIHDEDNYVIISFRDVNNDNIAYGVTMVTPNVQGVPADYSYTFTNSYVKAGAAFQSKIGLEGTLVHKDNTYGYPCRSTSFHGTPSIDFTTSLSNGYIKDAFTSVALDYETKCIYANGGLVTDLDNPNYYTDKWNGFTTGEAYLSIYAGKYEGTEPAKVFISNIDTQDLSNNRFVDTIAPVLSIDFDGLNGDNLPNGVVGYEYPIFKATALDSIDGFINVERFVYYNYDSSSKSICNIVNDKISLKRSGRYTILYTAEDSSGNNVTQRYDFYVVAKTDDMEISLLGENLVSANVGDFIQLASVEVANFIERYDTTIEVVCGDLKYDIKNGVFQPTRVGVHYITYTVQDMLGRTVKLQDSIEVLGEGLPVFYETAVFPKYLISGKEYKMPTIVAYDYSEVGIGKALPVKTYLTDKNGKREIIGETFVPQVNNYGDTILIEYVATNSTGSQALSYTIPTCIVTNDNGLDLTKYFVTNGDINITATSSYMKFGTQTDGSGFSFINSLLADAADIHFSIIPESNNFKSFDVYFKDSIDENIVLKFSFLKEGENVALCINNSTDKYTLDSSYFNDRIGCLLRFNAFVNTITTEEDESITIAINQTLQGEAFGGFTSGKVYISACFTGVTGKSEVKISKICGQPLTTTNKDNIKPAVALFGEYEFNYRLNDNVVLYDAIAGDVLDPDLTVTMSVMGPDKKYLTDINGLQLKDVSVDKYEIKLTQYGTYKIIYKAVDSSGKSVTFTQPLVVFDDVAPIFTVTNVPKSGKLNTEIKLPKATANDNVDGEVKVFVYVSDPSGTYIPVNANAKGEYLFQATKKGKYLVKYLAFDAFGNMMVESFEIKVG